METWLSPYASVWHQKYPDAVVPFKQLAKFLKPLVQAHPPERIAQELMGYLNKTNPQFLNLAKFVATFGSWNPPAPLTPAPVFRGCVTHPDRPSVAEVSRRYLCRDCFEAL